MKTTSKTPKTQAGFLSLKQLFTALLLLLTMSLWSCELFDKDKTPEPQSIPQPDKKPDQKPDPNPVSKLPTEILGKWSKGSFNMVDFFTYDGRYLSKGYESSRALSFTRDGQVEMYLYFHTYDGYCRSHAFTYIKGEARVEGNVLHIKAQSGKYRGVYGSICSPSLKNFTRDMTPDEVTKSVYKFYWSRQSYNGKEYLVTKFEPNAEDSASDFFVKTDW
jgi:hypothetical protein